MSDATDPTSTATGTSYRAHLVCYVLLSLLLVYVIITRYLRPLVLTDPIQVEPGRIAMIEQGIDPNTAPWPELARLPGIGELTAKKIIAYREERQKAHPDQPAFRSPADLEAIKGIGPKTVERLAPRLKFSDEIPQDDAESQPDR